MLEKEEFLALNTSAEATCDESLLNNNSRYEKSNPTWFGTVYYRFDAGLMCQ